MSDEGTPQKNKGCIGRTVSLIGYAFLCIIILVVVGMFLPDSEPDPTPSSGISTPITLNTVVPEAATDTTIPTQVPSATSIPTEETPMDLQSALEAIETNSITVTDAESFELSQTTQIVFTMPNNAEMGRAFMREALCAARPFVPDGYRIKVHGQNAAEIGVMTLFVGNATLMGLDCPFTGDLESIAEEYSEASGLR